MCDKNIEKKNCKPEFDSSRLVKEYFIQLNHYEKKLGTTKVVLFFQSGIFYHAYGVHTHNRKIGQIISLGKLLKLRLIQSNTGLHPTENSKAKNTASDWSTALDKVDQIVIPNNNKLHPLKIEFPCTRIEEYIKKSCEAGYYVIIFDQHCDPKTGETYRAWSKTLDPITPKPRYRKKITKSEPISELTPKECPVCLEELKEDSEFYTPQCNHSIHFQCCKGLTSLRCPVCRGDFSPPTPIKRKILKNEKEFKREIEGDIGPFRNAIEAMGPLMGLVMATIRTESSPDNDGSDSPPLDDEEMECRNPNCPVHSPMNFPSSASAVSEPVPFGVLQSLFSFIRATRSTDHNVESDNPIPPELRGLVTPEEYRYNMSLGPSR